MLITTTLILTNTVILSLDRYPISNSEIRILELTNLTLTFVFTVEMLLMVLANGVKTYVQDSFNIIDALIVIISLVDSILSMVNQ